MLAELVETVLVEAVKGFVGAMVMVLAGMDLTSPLSTSRPLFL